MDATHQSKIGGSTIHPRRIVRQLVCQGLEGILILMSCEEFVAVVTSEHEKHEADEEKGGN